MDHLEHLAVQRALAALRVAAGDTPDDTARLCKTWAQVQRVLLIARIEAERTGESNAEAISEQLYGTTPEGRRVAEFLRVKTGVASGSTASGWATNEYAPQRLNLAAGLVALRQTVISQLTGTTRIGFNTPVGAVATSVSFGWVSEAGTFIAKALATALVASMKAVKLGGIFVVDAELARGSEIERLIESEVARVDVRAIDANSLDPSIAASGDLPASWVAGLTPVAGAGALASTSALTTKLKVQVGEALTAGADGYDLAWVGPPALASSIVALDPIAFSALSVRGGHLLGLPFIVSQGSPANQLALVDGGSLIWAADDAIEISVSREATISMDTNGSSTLVSLFGTDSVGLRVTRRINWRWRSGTQRASVMTSVS